jgi:1,4-dihydroxy-6-naphthoate synthase
MSKKLTIAYSTCPNDTFMFGALAKSLVKVSNFDLDIDLQDIEALNHNALNHKYDVSKISCALYPKIQDEYEILDSGSAIGYNNGPLLISKNIYKEVEYEKLKVAIPGYNTTANLLLTTLFPQIINKDAQLFSDIEEAVLSEYFDAGLIIHENRFTYQQKGLVKLQDLGEVWEQRFQMPIPLGCIVVRRNLPLELKQEIQNKISESISMAYENYNRISDYIKLHAQEMSEEVMKNHIGLYVNEMSIHLGDKGREAMQFFIEKSAQMNGIELRDRVFV